MAALIAAGRRTLTLGEFREWSKNLSNNTTLVFEVSPKSGSSVFGKVTRVQKIGKSINLYGKEQ